VTFDLAFPSLQMRGWTDKPSTAWSFSAPWAMLTFTVISPHGVQGAQKQATLTSCSVYVMSALSLVLYLHLGLSALQVPSFRGTLSVISCFLTPKKYFKREILCKPMSLKLHRRTTKEGGRCRWRRVMFAL